MATPQSSGSDPKLFLAKYLPKFGRDPIMPGCVNSNQGCKMVHTITRTIKRINSTYLHTIVCKHVLFEILKVFQFPILVILSKIEGPY